MQNYLEIVKHILEKGVMTRSRTGIRTLSVAGVMFKHDMAKGFPLLTTKKMPFKCIASELEFFIKGITDKAWLQERKNFIWNEWANPEKAPYGHDEESKKRMMEEKDLGPVYGFQWRYFGADYKDHKTDYTGKGIDQLKILVNMLKSNPLDRRMIVSAWNPTVLHKMAIPPCHYSFQVTVIGNKLHLMWNQRSIDTMLGLPFNIASYAILLHLLAKEAKLEEGTLTGFLGNTHIYENHIDGAKEQITRDPNKHPLPRIETKNFKSIFDWKYDDTILADYESYPKIPFDIAV